MDFGLNESQLGYLQGRGRLLPRPAGLAPGTHPFRLKSSLDLYLRGKPGPWIWIDADMMAVRDCSQALEALCARAGQGGFGLALAGDMGPDRTLGAFARRYETPKLRVALDARPGLAEAPYLNTGLILFRDETFLAPWRMLSAEFEPDVLWEQNALNVVAHRAGPGPLVLDARRWNVQSALIDEVESTGGGLSCGEEEIYFVHATSSAAGRLAEYSFPVPPAWGRAPGYARLFVRPDLREMQMSMLAGFLAGDDRRA
jgi:hypothetical protein